MKWNSKQKNNGWKVRFAFLPLKIGDTYVWLERYISRFEGIYIAVDFYEGCAERVGWPCDCFRH